MKRVSKEEIAEIKKKIRKHIRNKKRGSTYLFDASYVLRIINFLEKHDGK